MAKQKAHANQFLTVVFSLLMFLPKKRASILKVKKDKKKLKKRWVRQRFEHLTSSEKKHTHTDDETKTMNKLLKSDWQIAFYTRETKIGVCEINIENKIK
jgi:hypothetical protein